MPDPVRHLRTLRQAAELTRACPGRTGRLVQPDADELLVAGDLHGHLGHFQALLKLADLGRHPRRHAVFQEVIHGPFEYPDGSDKSHQLLDLIAALTVQYPGRVHFLPGNHELAQMTHRPIAKGDRDLNEQFLAGVEFAYTSRVNAVVEAYWNWVRCAPLAVKTANGVFVSHSIVPRAKLGRWDDGCLRRNYDPMEVHPGGPVYDMIWGRDVSADAADGFRERVGANFLITGHIPCPDGFARASERHVIIDTHDVPAAYWFGPATAELTPDLFATAVKLLDAAG